MLRRTIGISAAAAAISIAAIIPASAQTSPGGLESYAAGAKATALDLTVFGQELTVSDTAAGIDSSAKAVADGKALLTPLYSSAGAPVASNGTTTGSDCQEIDLPSPVNLAAIDLVCVNTSAVLTGGNPIGSSTSNQVVIEVKAGDLIATTPLADVVGQIQDGLGSLFDALVPITQPIEDATQIELQGIVDGLLSEVQTGDVLVRITVAPTVSTSQFGATGVAANAVSNGVIVELLPNLPGGALAVATVGASTAGVVRDATTGAPTLSGAAAVLNVTYPNGLLGGLGVLTDALGAAVNVTIDQLACNAANPLADVICFTVGANNDLDAAEAKALGLDFGPSTVGRETSVLGLTLLAAAPEGGIVLNVGHTAAAAGSAVPAPQAAAPGPLPRGADPLVPSARTGGEAATGLTLALLAVGAAGVALVRRSRTV
jgi:hypothetical protein